MKIFKMICILLISASVFAQRPHMDDRKDQLRERLETHKIAFITEQVGLTPEEAKVFWPVYEQFDEKRNSLRGDQRPERASDELSEEEALKRVKEMVEQDQKMTDLRAEYTDKFLDILPAKKVLKLQRAEMEFKREMLRKVRERMHKGRQRQ